MKLYLPLLCIEGYLISTIALFFFGPVHFSIHNELLFALLMLLYHSFFAFGYWVSIKTQRKHQLSIARSLSPKLYYSSLILGVVGIFGAYNNLMLSNDVIPYDFFPNLIRGLAEPGLVYTERMLALDAGVTADSRLFNITSLFFSFFKLLHIFIFVYYWGQLQRPKKYFAVAYGLLFVSSGISSGVNSVLFIFFIFLNLSILLTLYIKENKYLRSFVLIVGASFLVPIASFGRIMSERGGGFEYFAGTSPLGDISVSAASLNIDDLSLFDFFYYSFVWLDYYITQGYYGFSLILNLDHNWTFGFGNSAFLQRQFAMITGLDISSLTFQHRISSYWDESAQWHSFYGQFANDFGLVGLVFFMFLLGYILGKVWASVVNNNSFYGAALMPLYSLMFIFFPANNQVFAYIDTLSYFIFVHLLWFFESTRKGRVNHV